jgi:5'-3' exonuclease
VSPPRIPDYLALVGDSADGYPGVAGIGPKGAASLIERHGRIEDFPPHILGERRELALLFKTLATLKEDATLFANVEQIRWQGPTRRFGAVVEKVGDPRLASRAEKALAAAKQESP